MARRGLRRNYFFFQAEDGIRDIEHDDVGREPGVLLEHRPPVADGPDDFELGLEESNFDREELLVVVGQEYPDPTQGFFSLLAHDGRTDPKPPAGCPVRGPHHTGDATTVVRRSLLAEMTGFDRNYR